MVEFGSEGAFEVSLALQFAPGTSGQAAAQAIFFDTETVHSTILGATPGIVLVCQMADQFGHRVSVRDYLCRHCAGVRRVCD